MQRSERSTGGVAMDLAFAAEVLEPVTLLAAAGSGVAAASFRRITHILIADWGTLGKSGYTDMRPILEFSHLTALVQPVDLEPRVNVASTVQVTPKVRAIVTELRRIKTTEAVSVMASICDGIESSTCSDGALQWRRLRGLFCMRRTGSPNAGSTGRLRPGLALIAIRRIAKRLHTVTKRLSDVEGYRELGTDLGFLWNAWVMPGCDDLRPSKPTIIRTVGAAASALGIDVAKELCEFRVKMDADIDLARRTKAFWLLYDLICTTPPSTSTQRPPVGPLMTLRHIAQVIDPANTERHITEWRNRRRFPRPICKGGCGRADRYDALKVLRHAKERHDLDCFTPDDYTQLQKRLLDLDDDPE